MEGKDTSQVKMSLEKGNRRWKLTMRDEDGCEY